MPAPARRLASAQKRGRPRLNRTLVVNVRLTIATYDAYCRCAVQSGQDVRTILRHVLTLHAPSA
jgi:hypothetical protein